MADLRPTGTCFTDALEFLAGLAGSVSLLALREYRLVHGLCLHPEGDVFAHAWVEHAGFAIFAALDQGARKYFRFPACHYRRKIRVIELRRYTAAEAWAENERTMHYGPWLTKYRERCRDFVGPPRPYLDTSAAACPASADRPEPGSRLQFGS